MATWERLHDRGRHRGYWRELLAQNRANLTASPAYSLEDLTRIEAPTLLISGENDPWANLQQMVAMRGAIPEAELLIVNDAGHDVHATHPDTVAPRILDFLARHRPGGR